MKPRPKVQMRPTSDKVPLSSVRDWDLKYCLLPPFRIPSSEQDRSHPRCSSGRSDRSLHRARGSVPAQTVSEPALCSRLSLPLISHNTTSSAAFLFLSSAFPLWSLRMAFAFTLSSPFTFSLPLANSVFLFIWICVPALTGEEFELNVSRLVAQRLRSRKRCSL